MPTTHVLSPELREFLLHQMRTHAAEYLGYLRTHAPSLTESEAKHALWLLLFEAETDG